MNNKTAAKVHWSFWVIGIFMLIWNAMGGVNFIMQMNPDSLASYPESHQAIIVGRPLWATAGFALCVFGGALGCLLLLFRKSWAFYLFIASLLGVIVTSIHTFRITSSPVEFSTAEVFVMAVLPIIMAALLVWYAKWAQMRRWIR